jgi:hypothetical protein
MEPLLPLDYASLDAEGQRLARRAAYARCESPEAFEAAYSFFCDWCLCRQPGDDRLPRNFFYREPRYWTPEFHRELIRDIGRHSQNICQWPRRSGKSTVLTLGLSLFLALTRERFEVLILSSGDRKAGKLLDRIIKQLQTNPLVIADFGDQKCTRAEGVWNRHDISLRNGSRVASMSWDSKQLLGEGGGSDSLIIVDDIEGDQRAKDPAAVREKIDDRLSGTIEPMLEAGTAICFIGTLLSRSSYAHYIATVPKAEDPKWGFWNRVTLSAEWIDDKTGERRLLWPEKWPADVLDAQRLRMRDGPYAAHFLNKPGADDVALFRLDERYHFWRVERPDRPPESDGAKRFRDAFPGSSPPPLDADRPHPCLDPDPLTSVLRVCWSLRPKALDGRDVEMAEEAGPHFGRMFRMLTVDFAPTMSSQSDYSGVLCTGFDGGNAAWLLDLWLGKVPEEELIQRVYSMAAKWRVGAVVAEDVGRQATLRERIRTRMLAGAEAGEWAFAVGGTKYLGAAKEDRIASLEWRFSSDKVYYPAGMRGDLMWNQLLEQTRLFDRSMALLPHDDAIDMFAMTHFSPERAVGALKGDVQGEMTALDHVRRGEVVDKKNGTQWGLAIEPTPELARNLREIRRRNRGTVGKGGRKWQKP